MNLSRFALVFCSIVFSAAADNHTDSNETTSVAPEVVVKKTTAAAKVTKKPVATKAPAATTKAPEKSKISGSIGLTASSLDDAKLLTGSVRTSLSLGTGVPVDSITMGDVVAGRRLGEERRLSNTYKFPYEMAVTADQAKNANKELNAMAENPAVFKEYLTTATKGDAALSKLAAAAEVTVAKPTIVYAEGAAPTTAAPKPTKKAATTSTQAATSVAATTRAAGAAQGTKAPDTEDGESPEDSGCDTFGTKLAFASIFMVSAAALW